MPLMDEFKNEREAIKSKPFKQKFAYFWTYYKWHVLIVVVVLIFAITTIRSFLAKREYSMYGVLLNAYPLTEQMSSKEDTDPFTEDFELYSGIDTKKYRVGLNHTLAIRDTMDQTSISATQFIMVYLAAGDLDVVTMDPKRYQKYACEDTFMDLRDILSPQMLDKLSDHLYYADRAVIDAYAERDVMTDSIDDIVIPDPYSPELMESPIPIGIDLSDCEKFKASYFYDNDEAILGVIVNTKHQDMVLKFINYLFAE